MSTTQRNSWSFLAPQTCAHPLHGSSKAKPDRGVTKEVSMQIREIWERFVSVGSGKAIFSIFLFFDDRITNTAIVAQV